MAGHELPDDGQRSGTSLAGHELPDDGHQAGTSLAGHELPDDGHQAGTSLAGHELHDAKSQVIKFISPGAPPELHDAMTGYQAAGSLLSYMSHSYQVDLSALLSCMMR